jgi:hypothetical protein
MPAPPPAAPRAAIAWRAAFALAPVAARSTAEPEYTPGAAPAVLASRTSTAVASNFMLVFFSL